jgi:hypothetical protein
MISKRVFLICKLLLDGYIEIILILLLVFYSWGGTNLVVVVVEIRWETRKYAADCFFVKIPLSSEKIVQNQVDGIRDFRWCNLVHCTWRNMRIRSRNLLWRYGPYLHVLLRFVYCCMLQKEHQGHSRLCPGNIFRVCFVLFYSKACKFDNYCNSSTFQNLSRFYETSEFLKILHMSIHNLATCVSWILAKVSHLILCFVLKFNVLMLTDINGCIVFVSFCPRPDVGRINIA